MSPLFILRGVMTREELRKLAQERFGDMVKAVIDCKRRVMAIGGELHADAEQMLLEDGSVQQDLWGINLYPEKPPDEWIKYDSMINVRPAQGNRSRNIEDSGTRERIRAIVRKLIPI